ncbi:hypothetical protein JCM8097_001844 [Rhodosporidiobolus ruineniae]
MDYSAGLPAFAPDLSHPLAQPSSSTAGAPPPAQHALSPQENTSKSRQNRVARACDACRKRKVRCDGSYGGPTETSQAGVAEQPCSLCQAQGIPCTFEQRIQKRPPPKGYVEQLEQRLEAMESLLQSLSGQTSSDLAAARAQQGSAPPAPPAAVAPTAPPSVAGGAEVRRVSQERSASLSSYQDQPRSRPPSPLPTDLDAIQQLGERLDDLVVETDRYIGRGSGLHLVFGMHEHLSMRPPMSKDIPSLVDTLLHAEHCQVHQSIPLPPQDLADKLIPAAFHHLKQWPMLVRSEFEANVRKGLTETDASFRALYFQVCALGARFVDDPRLIPDAATLTRFTVQHPYFNESSAAALGEQQRKIAKGYQYFIAAPMSPLISATLFDLQASVLSVLWLLGSTGTLTAWTAVGFAIRRAVDVGAHREQRSRWSLSPLQDQQRKRAFLALIALDRFICAMLGRPLAISESDIDLQVPLEISDDDLLEWDRQTKVHLAKGLPSPPPPLPRAAATPLPYHLLSDPTAPKPEVEQRKSIWICSVELHKIMSMALKGMYGLKRDKSQQKTVETVCDLDSRLNGWLELVPTELQWNPSQMSDDLLIGSSFLMCAYYQCQIMVHREFISPSRSRALGFPSLAITTNAARSCARILDTLRQRGLLEGTFGWAPCCAVTSGLMLVLGAFAAKTPTPGAPPATLTSSAQADVQRCLEALQILSDSSFMALKCFEGLSRLVALVAPNIVAATPSGGLIVRTAASSSKSSSASPTTSTAGAWPGAGGQAGTGPGAALASSSGKNPLASSLKRANPDNVGTPEDASPASDRPSPQDSTEPAGSSKARKVGNLPFSTHDLSSSTFRGRPTFNVAGGGGGQGGTAPFAGAQSSMQPPVPSVQQQQQHQQQQTSGPGFGATPAAFPNLGFNTFTPGAVPPPASSADASSFDPLSFLAPTPAPPASNSFIPPTSAAAPVGLTSWTHSGCPGSDGQSVSASSFGSGCSSTGAGPAPPMDPFQSTDFWALPFDDPASSLPPAFGQDFAALMANFGMPTADETVGGAAVGGAAAGFGGADAFGLGGGYGATPPSTAGYDPSLFGGLSPFAPPSHPSAF